MSFENNIKHWVHLDNKIKSTNEELKKLRDSKNQLQEKILIQVKDNELTESTIKISDGSLKFSSSKITKPLTLKFIENCLADIINEPESISKIMNYIKSKREFNINDEIKRFYK